MPFWDDFPVRENSEVVIIYPEEFVTPQRKKPLRSLLSFGGSGIVVAAWVAMVSKSLSPEGTDKETGVRLWNRWG